MTAMESIADVTIAAATEMPRFADGFINLQEVLRQLAESVVNEIMSAEADQLCEATGNSRNGYRERKLTTCVGTLTLRIPKLRVGSFFPDDVIERYQRVDRAIVAAVSEMYATGTSTRKVQKVAAAMGIERLSKDQVSAIVEHLDSEVDKLTGRPLGGARMPYLWIDATYVKCRRDRRVASTAVVTAIGCDEDGWRHVLGLGVADTESYDSWLAFLRKVKARGVEGVVLVTSDAHEGLKRAISEVFQGAAWQRCAVHLMRDCIRAAGSRATAIRIFQMAFQGRRKVHVREADHEVHRKRAAFEMEDCGLCFSSRHPGCRVHRFGQLLYRTGISGRHGIGIEKQRRGTVFGAQRGLIRSVRGLRQHRKCLC